MPSTSMEHDVAFRAPKSPQSTPKSVKQRVKEYRKRQRALMSGFVLHRPLPVSRPPTIYGVENTDGPSTDNGASTPPRSTSTEIAMNQAKLEGSKYSPTTKICRLCAQTEGPFLNIFGIDMNLTTKIREVLPIEVDELDNLPHKICFLCSAKVTELHSFVNKCVETQKYFHETCGKAPFMQSNKARRLSTTLNGVGGQFQNDSNKKPTNSSINSQSKTLMEDTKITTQPNVALTRLEEEDSDQSNESNHAQEFDESHPNKTMLDSSADESSVNNIKYVKAVPPYVKTLKVTGFGAVKTCAACNIVLSDDCIITHNCDKLKNWLKEHPLCPPRRKQALSPEHSINDDSLLREEQHNEKKIKLDTENLSQKSDEEPPASKPRVINRYSFLLGNYKKGADKHPYITTEDIDKHIKRLKLNHMNSFFY